MNKHRFSKDILDFLRLAARHEVRGLIVGGEAVIYHGHLRLTGDTDFFYDSSSDNASRLFQCLQDFWGGQIPGLASPDELSVRGLIVQFGIPPNRLDLLNLIDGVTFEETWANRVQECIETAQDQVPVAFIGLPELIRNKAALARPRDLEDLAFLQAKLDS